MNVTKEKWIIKEGFSRGMRTKNSTKLGLSAPLQREKGGVHFSKMVGKRKYM